jgi:hypothetical protein
MDSKFMKKSKPKKLKSVLKKIKKARSFSIWIQFGMGY